MKRPKPIKSRKNPKDATIRLQMEQEILAIEKSSCTFEEALRIVVPHEANGDHCRHCHGIFHKAWDSLVRQGLIEKRANLRLV